LHGRHGLIGRRLGGRAVVVDGHGLGAMGGQVARQQAPRFLAPPAIKTTLPSMLCLDMNELLCCDGMRASLLVKIMGVNRMKIKSLSMFHDQ
jgi:hypothetical protein